MISCFPSLRSGWKDGPSAPLLPRLSSIDESVRSRLKERRTLLISPVSLELLGERLERSCAGKGVGIVAESSEMLSRGVERASEGRSRVAIGKGFSGCGVGRGCGDVGWGQRERVETVVPCAFVCLSLAEEWTRTRGRSAGPHEEISPRAGDPRQRLGLGEQKLYDHSRSFQLEQGPTPSPL